jgi:Kef-type K+ transport system membrane component KefB
MLIAELIHTEAPQGPALPFLVLFGVILAGPMIIERFRVPGIIGLLLGGLLIGPHGLGIVGGGNTTVPDLGQVGLLYLMFVAGLELDLRLVQAHRNQTIAFASMTFVLPMAGGLIAGFAIGFSAAAAVLLGSLLASHTLVVYPTIREMGRGDDPAVATGVGATVVTDTLSLVVLAIVVGTTSHASATDIAVQVAFGLAIVVFGCFFFLPRFARLFLGRFGTARTSRYLFALVAMLGAATLAEVFGIEGIVGAFFAGLALNRSVPNEGDLMSRIEFFGGAVFVPVFLVSVGLIIDPSVMADPETLRLGAIFIVACFGGKGLASLLAHPLLKYGWPEVGVLFSLTIPQAAATLAATIVGYDVGLFSTKVVNAVLVLIAVSLVVSAVTTPIFTRRLPPSTPPAGLPGKRVLLVFDPDSTPRRRVIDLAVRLARSDDGIVIPVVVAEDDDPDAVPVWPGIESMLVALGVDRAIEVFCDHTTADGIRHAARSNRASSVVVDDPSGEMHDAMQDTSVERPVIFVGTAHDRLGRAVLARGATDDDSPLADLTRRLATSSSATDDDSCDLLVLPAGAAPPGDGERELTFVRVLSAGE